MVNGLENCIFCKILSKDIVYDGDMKDYKHWKVIVSREQHTLATLIIMLKRHTVRFSSVTKDELLEFNAIQKELEGAIDGLFNPDLYNYLQCGNAMEHLHVHLVPRYKDVRQYHGKTFTDEAYGDSVKEVSVVENSEMIKSLKKDILDSL